MKIRLLKLEKQVTVCNCGRLNYCSDIYSLVPLPWEGIFLTPGMLNLWYVTFFGLWNLVVLKCATIIKMLKCVCSLAQSLSLFSSAYKNDHAPRAFFFTLDQDGKYMWSRCESDSQTGIQPQLTHSVPITWAKMILLFCLFVF